MKLSHNVTNIFILVLITFVLNQFCFSLEESKYSDLLKEAVNKARQSRAGYMIESLEFWGFVGVPKFRPFVEDLDTKEAVPFLLDVIKKGPNWPKEDLVGLYHQQIAPHIARCYAVLCLASIKDPQAYSVLTDLLKNGTYLGDPNNIDDETKQKYDIKLYAAIGLGILGDDRAVDSLITSLYNPNQLVRNQSMIALAKISDMRTIESILNATEKNKLDDFALDACLYKMTKYRSPNVLNRNEKTLTFLDFPEMNAIKLEENPHTKLWQHWFKTGKNLMKQKFEGKYNEYSDVKHSRPNEKSAISSTRNKIAELGVVALPLIIEKIEKGETDLTPLVSQLTNNKVKSDAEAKEVLNWWKENKERWTIFK